MNGKCLLAIAVLWIAGCSEPNSANPIESDPPSQTLTGSNGPQTRNPPSPNGSFEQNLDFDFELNGCHGIRTTAQLPSEVVGAQPLPGWEPGQTPFAETWIFVYSCERINFGIFERPVRIVLEFHDNRKPVAACEKGGIDSSEILTQWWVSDEELALKLQTTFDFPVSFAEIDDFGDANISSMQFATPSSEQSELSSTRISRDGGFHSVSLQRLFWMGSGGKLHALDWKSDLEFDTVESINAEGRLAEPFLYSRMGVPIYEGSGASFIDGFANAEMHTYEDVSCA